MPTVDERLASLEAKVEAIVDLRNVVVDLRTEMNQRFNQIDTRFTIMDAKFDRLFVWVIGLLVGGFTSVIGALVAVVYR